MLYSQERLRLNLKSCILENTYGMFFSVYGYKWIVSLDGRFWFCFVLSYSPRVSWPEGSNMPASPWEVASSIVNNNVSLKTQTEFFILGHYVPRFLFLGC